MPKYEVTLHEEVYHRFIVEADTKEQANKIVINEFEEGTLLPNLTETIELVPIAVELIT